MKIRRDITALDGFIDKSNNLRLTKAEKEELTALLIRIRTLTGIKGEAHSVQLVFTGDEKETVLTIY